MKLGVMVLDTLRYDVARNQMNSIWDLTDHKFDNMYSTSRWTIASHASLFTGLYPSESGTHHSNQYLSLDKPVLAERLSEAGFDTHLYSNNPYIDSFFNFDRGFHTHERGPACRGRPQEKQTNIDWSQIFSEIKDSRFRHLQAVRELVKTDTPTHQALTEGVRMKLKPTMEEATFDTNDVGWFFEAINDQQLQTKDDLFVYANLMPCHYPYNPPDEYRDLEPYNEIEPQRLAVDSDLSEEHHDRQSSCYQGAARYLDNQIRDIVDLCDWDVLFIISDHGELFGEHDLRLHNYGVYEELTHVPAVALGNEVSAGRTEELTSLLDIHETLLRLADTDPREDDRGINLFGGSEREYVYAESTGIENPHCPPSWDELHYSLVTSDGTLIHDKDGTRVVDDQSDGKDSDLEHRLISIADEVRSGWEIRESNSTNTEVPDDVDDRLEALGYK
jgi:arylsulfatase